MSLTIHGLLIYILGQVKNMALHAMREAVKTLGSDDDWSHGHGVSTVRRRKTVPSGMGTSTAAVNRVSAVSQTKTVPSSMGTSTAAAAVNRVSTVSRTKTVPSSMGTTTAAEAVNRASTVSQRKIVPSGMDTINAAAAVNRHGVCPHTTADEEEDQNVEGVEKDVHHQIEEPIGNQEYDDIRHSEEPPPVVKVHHPSGAGILAGAGGVPADIFPDTTAEREDRDDERMGNAETTADSNHEEVRHDELGGAMDVEKDDFVDAPPVLKVQVELSSGIDTNAAAENGHEIYLHTTADEEDTVGGDFEPVNSDLEEVELDEFRAKDVEKEFVAVNVKGPSGVGTTTITAAAASRSAICLCTAADNDADLDDAHEIMRDADDHIDGSCNNEELRVEDSEEEDKAPPVAKVEEPSSGVDTATCTTASSGGPEICLHTSAEDDDANEEVLDDGMHDEIRGDAEPIGSNYEEVRVDEFRAEKNAEEIFVKAPGVKVEQSGVGTSTTITAATSGPHDFQCAADAGGEDLRDAHQVDAEPVVTNEEEVRVDEVRAEDEEDLVKVKKSGVGTATVTATTVIASGGVSGGGPDMGPSTSRPGNGMALWEGHMVLESYVDLFSHMKKEHPETFRHHPNNNNIHNSALNFLGAAYVSFATKPATAMEVDDISYFRGLFSDLEQCFKFDVGWLRERIDHIEEELFKSPLAGELLALSQFIEARERELSEVRALYNAKLKEIRAAHLRADDGLLIGWTTH